MADMARRPRISAGMTGHRLAKRQPLLHTRRAELASLAAVRASSVPILTVQKRIRGSA
jgi:hypothetical protein